MLTKTVRNIRRRRLMPIPYPRRSGYDQTSIERLRAAQRVEVEKIGGFYVFGIHPTKHSEEISEWVAEHLEEHPLADTSALDTAEIVVPVDGWWFMRQDVVVTANRDLAFDLLRNVIDPRTRKYKKAWRVAKNVW